MSSNRKKTIQAIESLSSEIFYAKVRKEEGIENATHGNENMGLEIDTPKKNKIMGIENATLKNETMGIGIATHESDNKGFEIDTQEDNKSKGIENTTHKNKPKGIENATPKNENKGLEIDTHSYCLDALKSLKRQNKGLTALGMLFLIKSMLPENGGRIKIDHLVAMTGMAKSNILAQFEALETSGIIATISRDRLGRLIQFADKIGGLEK